MKHFQTYWYNLDHQFRKAHLYNLRDSDAGIGGRIKRGDVVAGRCGYHIAEADVLWFCARSVVGFHPNRKCEWYGLQLECMSLSGLPKGPVPRGRAGGLRHRHCVVAELVTPVSLREAKRLNLPVIKISDGRYLANLEVASIPNRQGACRRARLL